jgi:hypothetical protein
MVKINSLLNIITLFEKLANDEIAESDIKPITAYHGSQVRITRFSPKHSAMAGVIWFTENYENVKNGGAIGIAKPKYVMKVELTPRKT